MRTIFYLKTCSTCQRILTQLPSNHELQLREIKSEPISKQEIEKMAELTGSYESLFSRRALKYKSMGLKDKSLSEDDYKALILDEYTFLKRPVAILDDQIFVGNSKKNVANLVEALS